MIKRLARRILDAFSTVNHWTGYLLNDPTTPNLSEIMPMPSSGPLKFNVQGMIQTPKNSMEIRSSNCHVLIGNCLNNIQMHSKSPIRNWAGTTELLVNPTAGKDMNAFYDRRSLKFFYYPYAGKNVYFADSADIVTHELGHAFLDAMRPDFWSVQSLEIWSFHEAFSDIVAMFNLMNYDKAIKLALEQTGGELGKSNVISKLAEEVGAMIKGVTKDPSYLPDALRDPALEHFNYVSPSSLPENAPNNMLAAECHSFGRVFSGAWYSIFVKFFEHHSASADPFSAFKMARDAAFSILMHSIPVSPRVDNYYSAISKSMLIVAKAKDQKYYDMILDVFSGRGLLGERQVSAQSSSDLRRHLISSLSRNDTVIKTEKSVAICIKNRKLMDFGDLPIASSMSLNRSLKIEVPYDSYYEFDELGNLQDQIIPDDDKIRASVADCVLKIADEIGEEKMWEIQSGVLKRRFIR